MPVELVFRHAWLLFIAVTCANGAIWWHRAQRDIAANPEREQSYRRLIRGWMIYGNVPWLVMGAGIVSGNLRGVFDYFNPRNGAFVIAWFSSVVALWILGFVWIFMRGGAEQLATHGAFFNSAPPSAGTIKMLYVAVIAGGVVALIAIFTADVRPPTG